MAAAVCGTAYLTGMPYLAVCCFEPLALIPATTRIRLLLCSDFRKTVAFAFGVMVIYWFTYLEWLLCATEKIDYTLSGGRRRGGCPNRNCHFLRFTISSFYRHLIPSLIVASFWLTLPCRLSFVITSVNMNLTSPIFLYVSITYLSFPAVISQKSTLVAKFCISISLTTAYYFTFSVSILFLL